MSTGSTRGRRLREPRWCDLPRTASTTATASPGATPKGLSGTSAATGSAPTPPSPPRAPAVGAIPSGRAPGEMAVVCDAGTGHRRRLHDQIGGADHAARRVDHRRHAGTHDDDLLYHPASR